MRSSASAAAAVGLAVVAMLAPAVAAQGAKAAYAEALGREEVLRRDLDTQGGGVSAPLLRRIRMLVGEYEAMARRYRRSGYGDNALFQGAMLSADAFWQFGDDADRRTALRLFRAVRAEFPTSSLVSRIAPQTARLDAAAKPAAPPGAPKDERPALKAIRREALPDTLRVVLELERETPYHEERLDGPPRVFIDLRNARPGGDLRDATLGFPDDVVRQIRVGRQQGATRVVLDLEGASRHSVYALYNPYRVVIDFERPSSAAVVGAPPKNVSVAAGDRGAESAGPAKDQQAEHAAGAKDGPEAAVPVKQDEKARDGREQPGATWTPGPDPAGGAGAPATGAAPAFEVRATEPSTARSLTSPPAPAPPAVPAPAPPSANSKGGFSLSRQLGLGISRVVIDAGHGGHDPGARVKGLNEADVTLDVALRVEKLLLQIPRVEVILTRRTNVYIPLEERTAIANRAGADLFLSIHVNAAANPRIRGIETYFLNFAPSKEAEMIAARENAGSSKTMNNLPDIVKAIALNNKLDESRDFAALVQTAMMDRIRKANREARNLGVKQAPFMVLIGATMPSVLAEISFLTNRQEASLLKTAGYRQAIADALVAGISRYQRSLKGGQSVASQ